MSSLHLAAGSTGLLSLRSMQMLPFSFHGPLWPEEGLDLQENMPERGFLWIPISKRRPQLLWKLYCGDKSLFV
jgi:hypothetical protein